MNRQPFPGFPARSNQTPLPDLFFSKLLPETDSLPELKVLLHIFWRLYRKRGIQRFVTHDELAADDVLMQGLGEFGDPAEALREALKSAGALTIEMPRNSAKSFCCGAGGAQMWKEEEAGSGRVNEARFQEAKATGVYACNRDSRCADPHGCLEKSSVTANAKYHAYICRQVT